MKKRLKKVVVLLLLGLGFATVMLGLKPWLFSTGYRVSEFGVDVVRVKQLGHAGWIVPKDAVDKHPWPSGPFVARLRHLRAERLAVTVLSETVDHCLVRSAELKPGDLVVREPNAVLDGQAVAPAEGVDNERLIRLTLEAGIAAAIAKNLDEIVRFISLNYQDNLGFDFTLMTDLLKRAYEEFDQPRIELAEEPLTQIEGNQAVVHISVRATAVYQGYRNYLLGDPDTPNNLVLILDKSRNGWKVSRIEGLRPLGFGERFLKLLGSQVGLPLTEAEQLERQQFCMPCRQRMAERFAPTR